MAIQPRKAPRHQTGVLLPRARIRFSVLMDSIRHSQMALTRLFGGFSTDARMLPTSVVIPMTALTAPIAVSPPLGLDSTMAGKAA